MTQLILGGLFIFIVAISALVGLVRGMNKSIIRMITFAFAIILTFCISVPVTNLIADNVLIEGQTLGELLLNAIRSEEMIAGILNESPLLEAAILVLPTFAIAILVFPLIFFLCSFISWIVFLCIQKPLRKKMFKETFEKRKKNKKEETIENTESAEIAEPVMAAEAASVQEQSAAAEEAQAAVLTETVEPAEPVVTEEPAVKAKPSLGVRFGKRMAGLGIGAVIGVLIFGMIFSPLLGIFSVLPENNALNEVIDTLVDQEMLEADLAEILRTELSVRESGLFKLYGIIGITLAGKTYLSSASKFEAEGMKSSIPAEFDAIFSVVQSAIEGGLLKALMNSEDQNELFAVLSNQSVMDEMMQSMLQSKLFRSAVPRIAALAMESVAQSLKVPADKEAVYNNMMDDIATAVKDSDIDYELIKAYEDSLNANDEVDFTSVDNGVQPPYVPTKEEYEAEIAKIKALEEKISKIINTSVSGSTEAVSDMIAEQIVMNIGEQATENGSDVLNQFTAEDVKASVSAISKSNSRNSEAALSDVLEKMNDSEKFETDVATVESISTAIFESVSNAVSDDSKSEETASTLANVVSNFAGAVSEAIDENGQMDVAKLNFEKIAEAVTTLQNSTLKEVGSSVLDIMIYGELGDNEMISTAVTAVKESYDNGDNISGTINSAGALIVLGTTMSDGSTAAENIVESFTTLVKNLDETTMKLLPSILSDETFATLGVAEKYRKIAYNSVESLLRELMALKETENYDNEVNAILAVYEILTGGNMKDKEKLSELIGHALKSEVLLNTLNKLSVDVVTPEMLTEFKVPEKYSESVHVAMKALLLELKTLRHTSQYDNEVSALRNVFEILIGGNMKDKEKLSELIGHALKSEVLLNTLNKLSVDVVTPEMLTEFKVPEKYSESVHVAMKALLLELKTLRHTSQYDNEVSALRDIFDFIMKNNIKKLSEEQITELVGIAAKSDALCNTLTKTLPDILSTEMLVSFGIAEESAQNAYDIIKTFLDEIMVCRQNKDYVYNQEVRALFSFYKLLKKNDTAQIQNIANAAAQSTVVYNTLTSVSESNPFGLKFNNEEKRANWVQAIESAFAESTKTEKDKAVFQSIARILGLDKDVNLA